MKREINNNRTAWKCFKLMFLISKNCFTFILIKRRIIEVIGNHGIYVNDFELM